MSIENPLPWDVQKMVEMKAQADGRYYPAEIGFAVTVARERIDEWSYEQDPHGYCHERPIYLALADEVESLRARLDAIERRAQQIRGGLKPYARPVEIVDYLMGEQT